QPPDALSTDAGWAEFKKGFLIGGSGGALFAFIVTFLLSFVL
ncbi:MAG: photosystem I reaction center protein subunit XI, partial [Cyanothece sp. SIO1E1]|nr:photosystem I reaction center protein subunit XI [Cyanothece sp. SIO1E1]